MSKKLFYPLIMVGGVVSILIVVAILNQRDVTVSLVSQPTPLPTPLAVYAIEKLQQTSFTPVPIMLGRVISETEDSKAQLFSYRFSPKPGSGETKTVSGVMNVPKALGTYPVLVMLRGYISPESFRSGAGTQPSAVVFARNGFITIAPDFLGFGESDPRPMDSYEARFQTYTTALTLLSSLPNINAGLDASYSGTIRADASKIGLWGHSNGGHIALSVLAISKKPYPTVLWAPVSKSFPYSVLYYTDEEDDQGKATRKELSDFETLYDTEQFSPARYYDQIQASLQIHQGTNDEEVPVWWSRELAKTLEEADIDVRLFTYSGSDHNLRPAWIDVITRSLEFYKERLSR